jgi:hypothetical protein
MATGTVFDNPDTPIGVDSRDVTVEVELVASASGRAVGFVLGEDRSVSGVVAKSPDDTGRVEFTGLAFNTDITPAGTAYRATYKYGTVIYNILHFIVSAVGPTHIGDVLTEPVTPSPDFSADYTELFDTETTASGTPVAFDTPIIIEPYIDGPVELIGHAPLANHSGATGGAILSIFEGSTELTRGINIGTKAEGLITRRRFPAGFFATGVHVFELRKWSLLGAATATFGQVVSPISLECVRR